MKMVRSLALLVAVLAGAACGPDYLTVRPTEPLVASAKGVTAEVTKLWLTEDVRDNGLDEGSRLVVGLRLRNDGPVARRVSPGSFSCAMHLDPSRPGEARALLPGGGGEGEFPGELPDEGTLLTTVVVPPGQSREVWAIFEGYGFDGSEVPRRVTLTVPVEGMPPLVLTLADPARGALRWQAPPATKATVIGLKNVTLLAPGMGGPAPTTEITLLRRKGPILWDVGILSFIFAETQGHRLVSETSVFAGSGLTGHVTLPLLTWGSSLEPRQLGVYAGGSASFVVEQLRPPIPEMARPHIYGFLQAEGGAELDIGALRLARTPFPLSLEGRALPRWAVRIGYIQTWAGGATSGGFTTGVRFTW
jgi:hypothetical protein